MKVVLEIEDKSYQTVLDFISLLPGNQCPVLTEETYTTSRRTIPYPAPNLTCTTCIILLS